jgi:hypothetical protein
MLKDRIADALQVVFKGLPRDIAEELAEKLLSSKYHRVVVSYKLPSNFRSFTVSVDDEHVLNFVNASNSLCQRLGIYLKPKATKRRGLLADYELNVPSDDA